MPWSPRVLVLLVLVAAAPLAAQLPPVGVPQGLVRLSLGGRFDNWDQRFVNGVRQDAARDFVYDPLDGRILPALASAEADLRRVTGIQTISLSLGRTRSSLLVNHGTGNIGAAYGLTRRLTVFGTVPIVRVRIQARFDLDSTEATAGFNPTDPNFGDVSAASSTTVFFSGFQAALAALSLKLTNGDFDADPARKALAQQTLSQGTVLRTNLAGVFGSATFLPLAGSAAAGTITTPIEAVRTALGGLGVVLSGLPALPARGLTQSEFEGYFTNPSGPYQAQPFSPGILQYIGDIELGAAYTWLDHRPARSGLAVRSVLVGTVRLRTGQIDRADSFFDVGTGDRQPDLQGDLVTDVAVGRVGARFTGRYVRQLSDQQERRLTPPSRPLAAAAKQAQVEWDPGDIIEAGVEPFLRIAPTLALTAGVRHWSKGVDKYTFARPVTPIPGLNPDDLAIDSKQNGTAFSAGLSFSHDGRRADGTRGLPMDASLKWEKTTRSSLGRVPVNESVTVMLRFYRKLF